MTQIVITQIKGMKSKHNSNALCNGCFDNYLSLMTDNEKVIEIKPSKKSCTWCGNPDDSRSCSYPK